MNLPYFTDSSLKITGQFKASNEDFIVEEIPLYLPSGSGEHLYILFEKTGLTTDQLIQKCSQLLGVRAQNIGSAGKKDRVGITRQWLSFLKMEQGRLADLQIPGVRVLEMSYHRNKLRPGHLKGNRFHIVLRDVPTDAQKTVEKIFSPVLHSGLPNYFGAQRFGNRGDNPAIGLAILKEDWQQVFCMVLGNPDQRDQSPQIAQARQLFETGQFREALQLWPKDQFFPITALRRLLDSDGDYQRAGRQLPKNQLKFYLSSLQSFWFNASLSYRMPQINHIWQGDLAYLHRNGAVFRVTDVAMEQPRIDTFEVSPSGPMWGEKMILPEGDELQLEAKVLSQSGVTQETLKPFFRRWRITGERRAYRMPLTNMTCAQELNSLHLQFELPAGCYATIVIRELLKENYTEPEIIFPGS